MKSPLAEEHCQGATPGSFFCYLANQPVTITGDPVGLVVELIDNPSDTGETGLEIVLVLADHSRDGLEEGVYFFEAMVVHDHSGYDTPGQTMLTSHAQVRRSRDLSNNPAVAAAAKRIVDHLTEAKQLNKMIQSLETAAVNVIKDR